MGINWRTFGAIFAVGIILIAVGIALSWYCENSIFQIQSMLNFGNINQEQRYTLQGSLDWWKMVQSQTFQPLSMIFFSFGVLSFVMAIWYSGFALLSDWKQGKRQLLAERAETQIVEEEPPEEQRLPKVRKTALPIVSGILMIISSSIAITLGLSTLISFASNSSFYGFNLVSLFVGIWAILCFPFGLTGGIMSMQRKQFVFLLVAESFMLVAGFSTVIGAVLTHSGIGYLIAGIPIIILSLLSLIFTPISKNEFS